MAGLPSVAMANGHDVRTYALTSGPTAKLRWLNLLNHRAINIKISFTNAPYYSIVVFGKWLVGCTLSCFGVQRCEIKIDGAGQSTSQLSNCSRDTQQITIWILQSTRIHPNDAAGNNHQFPISHNNILTHIMLLLTVGTLVTVQTEEEEEC